MAPAPARRPPPVGPRAARRARRSRSRVRRSRARPSPPRPLPPLQRLHRGGKAALAALFHKQACVVFERLQVPRRRRSRPITGRLAQRPGPGVPLPEPPNLKMESGVRIGPGLPGRSQRRPRLCSSGAPAVPAALRIMMMSDSGSSPESPEPTESESDSQRCLCWQTPHRTAGNATFTGTVCHPSVDS